MLNIVCIVKLKKKFKRKHGDHNVVCGEAIIPEHAYILQS